MPSLNAPIRADSYPILIYWGGGALPIMTYKGRLYLKGAPFSGFRSMKGWGFHRLKG